jgi:hypothetical protein
VASKAATLSGQDARKVAGMQQMAKELKPSLVAAYSTPQSITIASKDGLVGLGGGSLLRLGSLLGHIDGIPDQK